MSGETRESPGRQAATAIIPLIVWLTVDTVWGSLAGLLAGSGVVLLLALHAYLAYRRFDRGLLLDLLLMSAISLPDIPGAIPLPAGLVSPGVELFCAALMLPVFFNRLPRTVTAGLEIPQAIKPLLARVMQAAAILLVLHALLLFGAWASAVEPAGILPSNLPGAIPGTREQWHAVLESASGPLFWILPGLLAAGWIIRTRRRLRTPDPDDASEWLAVVDTRGEEIARARRGLLHTRPDLLQHVVHLVIRDPSNESILLQKRRADRAAAPGLWDTAAAGHVRAGETAQAALVREAREELGITLAGKERWIGAYILRDRQESEYTDLWLLEESGPFRPDRSEMDALVWHTADQIARLADQETITRGALQDIELVNRKA
ncbi:MAG TPA: NUDIX domain-containing protein [Spirochaetota bacterium]|nr:NUDIX domain-containing protein [Spirochaetota bacterium]